GGVGLRPAPLRPVCRHRDRLVEPQGHQQLRRPAGRLALLRWVGPLPVRRRRRPRRTQAGAALLLSVLAPSWVPFAGPWRPAGRRWVVSVDRPAFPTPFVR